MYKYYIYLIAKGPLRSFVQELGEGRYDPAFLLLFYV